MLNSIRRDDRARGYAAQSPSGTQPRARAAGVGLLTTTALWLLMGACQTPPGKVAGSFVGTVADTDLLVAVVTDGDRLLAYVCDSTDTARWYDGPNAGATTTLASSAGDSNFTVTLSESGGGGEIVLNDGSRATFELAPAEGQAGLYIAAETIDDADYLGSWIVLADGSQRGLVMSRTAIVGKPSLDLTTLTATVPNVGTFQAAMFVPLSTGFGGGFNFGGAGFQGGGGFNFGGTGFQFGGFQFGGFQFGGAGFNFGGGGFQVGGGGFNFGT